MHSQNIAYPYVYASTSVSALFPFLPHNNNARVNVEESLNDVCGKVLKILIYRIVNTGLIIIKNIYQKYNKSDIQPWLNDERKRKR